MSVSRKFVLFVLLTALATPALAQEPPKLKESEVLKLIELLPSDAAIVQRLGAAKLGFKVDEAVLERFESAGASKAVLAALQKSSGDKRNQAIPAGETVSYEPFETAKDDHGAIELRGPKLQGQVEESSDIYDTKGERAVLGGGGINTTYELPAGNYTIGYAYAKQPKTLPVEVRQGHKTVVHLGAVAVAGKAGSLYSVYTADDALIRPYLGVPKVDVLLPGKYRIELNGVSRMVAIEPGKIAELPTGTFTVNGDSWVYRPVGDEKWQVSVSSGRLVDLFPGKYEWKHLYPNYVGNGVVDIKAGENSPGKITKKN